LPVIYMSFQTWESKYWFALPSLSSGTADADPENAANTDPLPAAYTMDSDLHDQEFCSSGEAWPNHSYRERHSLRRGILWRYPQIASDHRFRIDSFT
jgi:hypothetical protein